MTTSLSNIKVTDGTNNMVIKADDITLNGTSVLVDSATWGNIDGTLSNQTDLQTALNNKQDEATAVNYDNITNCITEIPQDIKLELNNGTLTLKAGSKVYVPNGAGVFDAITVPSDVVFHSGTIGTGTSDLILCCNLTGGFGVRATPDSFVSGETAPTNTSQIWYDTTNNMIKVYENGSWVQKSSLPIGIYHRENGNAVSIKQVFNGFGYIGSTVFALPGVKGLIPNGRNADGTLKNIEFTTNNVLVKTNTYLNRDFDWFIWDNSGVTEIGFPQISSRTQPSGNYQQWYNFEINQSYNTVTGIAKRRLVTPVLRFVAGSDGRIISFTPKTAFHAVDYNDFADLKEEVDNISVATDDTTVSKNTSNQLQAIGTINKNTATGAINPKYDWVGTLAEYNAQSIATSHPTWICYITDDITGGTSVYTKNEMDALLDDKLDADQLQVVSALPASPDPNTFYFVTD